MPAGSSSRASPEGGTISFADLAEARAELNKLVVAHRDSVNYFASDRGFHRVSSDVTAARGAEPPEIRSLTPGEKLGGVTTTFTCFESLEAAPLTTDPKAEVRDRARLQAFAESALDRPEEWRSEGAARRYCIVRAAGPILRAGLELTAARRTALADLVREVWEVVGDDYETRALYEVALPPRPAGSTATPGASPRKARSAPAGPATPIEPSLPPTEYRYPPNAFLTYWGLQGLPALGDLAHDDAFSRRSRIADGWLFGAVGREIALRYDMASGRDPQQLAWALCGVIAGRPIALAERTDGAADLVRAGLRAFFEQQLDDGTWDRGTALFHYPEAGNAYCYVFETLAELLSLALDPVHPTAEELRGELRPYLGNLLDAKDYLVRTARTLGPGLRGWSSNHHPHRKAPESWATATAFRFLQQLRCLVGIEVRRRALVQLGSTSPRESLDTLRKRGETWNAGPGAAGDLVASLFIHPTEAAKEPAAIDPDRTIFDEKRARSAILFGPPGTGKTTIAESVAGALDWEFVEISPADFLDSGMELVSARADEIFKQVMELDHCVVLFDEIDELIRSRTSAADPLERFFTTTMLPRLARLWRTGRVVFFVNTNSVSDVDPAVRRSQRFDAAIFVMPPSLARKVSMLPEKVQALVDANIIGKVLAEYDTTLGVVTAADARLGWFPFLRYDQIRRLAETASEDREMFLDQIARFGTDLVSSDWALSIEQSVHSEAKNGESLNDLQRLVRAYKAAANFQRLDSGRVRLVRKATDAALPAALTECGVEGYVRWDDGGPDSERVPLNGAGEWVGS